MKTQNAQLADALLQGVMLTPLSGLKIAGVLRLSERCREMERAGVKIIRKRLRTSRVMSYVLDKTPRSIKAAIRIAGGRKS